MSFPLCDAEIGNLPTSISVHKRKRNRRRVSSTLFYREGEWRENYDIIDTHKENTQLFKLKYFSKENTHKENSKL